MSFLTEIASLIMIVVLSGVAASQTVHAQARDAQERRAAITLSDATRIALERFPGGRVLEIEHDYEAGREVFEAEVRDRDGVKHDVVIDAVDGRIIRTAVDDD